MGIITGQADYLPHIVVPPPLSVEYFLCEGERKAALLCFWSQHLIASSRCSQYISFGVLYIKNKHMAMIYTTFTLPFSILVISLAVSTAYPWWPLSAGTVGSEQDPLMPWQVQRGRKGQELQHYTSTLFMHRAQTTSSFKREWLSRGKVNKAMVFKGS